MIISKVSRSRVPSELRCKAQADLEKTSWKEVDINTRRTPSTDISHPYSEIIALSVELVKFNFSTTRPTSRTPSTIVLPHLLLKLIEDELDYNVVLHLQQFRRPLGDPGLQNIQLDLNGKISIYHWLRRGHCLALRHHLQNCNSWRSVVETFLGNMNISWQ